MSDSLTRGFGAQLTTSMDAVLRRAVFEIMNIFENTVYDYKMEIAQRGEEVAQLKIKLQSAELKLKDNLCGSDGGHEIIQIPSQTETPPEATTENRGQPPDVSKVDVDVPEDWCEPVGSETVTVQDDGVSPSIKLRRLTIPLWHIPIHKTEGGDCDVASYLETCRHSERIPGSNSQNIIPVKKVAVPNQKGPLLKLKPVSSDQAQDEELRRSKRKSAEEVNTQVVKRKKNANGSAVESRSSGVNTVGTNAKSRQRCKICRKIFDTDFGQQIHARLHRKCWGCKKAFPSQKELIFHKVSCMKVKDRSTTTSPTKLSSEHENGLTASKTRTTNKKESTPSSDSKLSTQRDASTKVSCSECDKKCGNLYLLSEHMKVHLRKKLIPCSLCQVMCHTKKGMKIHKARAHKDTVNSDDGKDLTWTEPLEEIDDETQDLISICTKSSQTSSPHDEEKPNSALSLKWQRRGKDEQKHFTCYLCCMMFKDKNALIEHMGAHK